MRKAKLGLLAALLVVVAAYVIDTAVLPRLGLRIGFEAGLVLQGAIMFIGYVLAGIICCGVAITAARALRRSAVERTFVGYAVLVISTLVTLGGAVLVVWLVFCYVFVYR
jgi:hypothetical protein